MHMPNGKQDYKMLSYPGNLNSRCRLLKKDNECQFGKWLYSLSPAEMGTEDYQKVKALHADFHRIAGQILEMALTNKKAEALKMIDVGGAYIGATGKLVIALNNWKSKL